MATYPAEPAESPGVPPLPAASRRDVTRIEALLRSLLTRHDVADVARILVDAASRNLGAPSRPRGGLAEAMARGIQARQSLKDMEGGGVSAEEARPFLGFITRQAVLDRYKRGRLLGWRETRQNAVRFPVWQFASDGMLPGMEAVLAILRASAVVDDWAAVAFFLAPRESLGGRRPLDALREGRVEDALRAAEAYVAR